MEIWWFGSYVWSVPSSRALPFWELFGSTRARYSSQSHPDEMGSFNLPRSNGTARCTQGTSPIGTWVNNFDKNPRGPNILTNHWVQFFKKPLGLFGLMFWTFLDHPENHEGPLTLFFAGFFWISSPHQFEHLLLEFDVFALDQQEITDVSNWVNTLCEFCNRICTVNCFLFDFFHASLQELTLEV